MCDLSPRRTVRVYAADAAGEVVNSCPLTASVGGEVPATSWAMNLAGTDGLYRYLGFDLDAKGGADAVGQVLADVELLTGLLDELRIGHVVCVSGPSGGRHVWVALADPLGGETVAQLARLARAVLPSLDIAPLSNAATGCLRPPGAPHRSGGASTILTGSLDTLRAPSTIAAEVRSFMDRLEAMATTAAAAEDAAPAPVGPLPVDEHGHVYLPGVRRPLSPSAAAAVESDAAAEDASAVLWRILLGAAAARWRYADVAELARDRPGLEQVRTVREGARRRPRPGVGKNSPAGYLRRQWDKAVRQIAASDRKGTDPTFERRAAAIAAHVRGVQDRADATPGRWAHGGGPADRRVLDVLCTLALEAVSARVEADIRRLALLAGIGRETARTGLLRLAQDGWISRVLHADGPHGAHWTIDPQKLLHREFEDGRSQADTRRGSAERSLLLTELIRRTGAARHDVFTVHSALGLLQGNVYARLSDSPRTLPDLATALGLPLDGVRRILENLAGYGLVKAGQAGWALGPVDVRDALAVQLGVDGVLEARRKRYAVERELWAWWQAEQVWMATPPHKRSRRRPGPGQLALLPDVGTNRHGAHPRRPDGTADFKAARAFVDGPTTVVATNLPEPIGVTTADELVARILGARLIRTERITSAETVEAVPA